MQKEKITGTIISKEHQQLSDNYKLKIITLDKQEIFFYSQQRHRKAIWEISINEKYSITLFKGKKYWFLENWEKAEETSQEIPEWLSKKKEELSDFNLKNLQEQAKVKQSEQLENKLGCLTSQVIKTIRESNTEEEVFLEYLEQFTNLLLIKHLSIKNKQEHQLTKKEKKEREILDKIVAGWFYKASYHKKEEDIIKGVV